MSSSETLIDLIRTRTRDRPEAELFVGGTTCRTWADFDTRTKRVARMLRHRGLGRGDRAGLLAANCPEWMEVFVGVQRAGGVVVPVSERLTPVERQWLLDDAGASVLVGAPDLLATTGFAGPTVALGDSYEALLAGVSHDELDDDIHPDALAVIVYTSGTTGVPKGVMWSHRGLFASARRNPFPAELAGGARILVCPPLYAGGAIVMACNAIAIGAALVIARFSPEGILRTLVEDGIEFTGLVPTMISLLVDAAPAGWQAPRLRRIYYGGGTMSPQLFARAQELFACELEQGYGMTETCIFGTHLAPADHRLDSVERLASAGKPMPGVEVSVADHDGTEAPPGRAGEILIRSPATMLGYWHRDDETGQAFDKGWYRTRDIGYFDTEGYLHLLDRKDDMVKSGGLNVSPAEVESVLTAHPDVEEAAVIGLPDQRWGERVTAVVRTRADIALAETALAAFCRGQLADYKTPRTILFTESPLPRTGLGKISRQAVRKQYGSRQTA